MLCAKVTDGGLFTGVMLMKNVCAALVFTPPLAVPPLSCATTVIVAVPVVDPAVNVSVPLLLIAGCTVKSALLLFVTLKLTVCEDSLEGPGEMLVTAEVNVCAAFAATVSGADLRAMLKSPPANTRLTPLSPAGIFC